MSNVLIVTVTKVEAQTVLELFPKVTGGIWERTSIGSKIYYSLGQIGATSLFMVQSEMGAVGPGAALLTIHNAIEAISPVAVIMVGLAFGVDSSRQKLGDILVSRQIQCYELQKLKNSQRLVRGDRVVASVRLLDKFRSGDNDWRGAPVHFGLILSGEKLIDDRSFRDSLIATEPECIGGEMEGAGLYAAANDAKVDWILVKAICDWADGNKNYDAQPTAVHNAVDFVLHVIIHVGLDSYNEVSPSDSNDGSPSRKAALHGKILLIDDDTIVCRDLEKRIQSSFKNCKTKTTTNPNDALDLVSSFLPDLVLLDLEMPDKRGIPTVARGLSLLSEIKGANKALPVVVLTAFDETLLVVEAMRLGASYYLIKNDPKLSTSLLRVVKNELTSVQSASSPEYLTQLTNYRLENNVSLLDLCAKQLALLESGLKSELNSEKKHFLEEQIQQLRHDIRLHEEVIEELEQILGGLTAGT